MSELLPCPFCGGEKPEPELNAQNWPMVQCIDCGACGPCIDIDATKAAAGWNNRAAQQDGGWRTDMENTPKDRPYLVEEDDSGHIQYHVARYTGANRSILVIGGHFSYDMGRITRWREFSLPATPEQGRTP